MKSLQQPRCLENRKGRLEGWEGICDEAERLNDGLIIIILDSSPE